MINGLYNGELMYDLETEDGKEAFEEVPESELNQEQPLEKVEKPAEPTQKEPWEMTKDEFEENEQKTWWLHSKVESYDENSGTSTVRYELKQPTAIGNKVFASTEIKETERSTKTKQKGIALDLHKQAIQQALSEGKQVPAEVLADYPELVKGVKNEIPVSEAKPTNNKVSAAQAEADAALQDFLDAFNDLNSDNLGIVDNTAEKQAKMLVAGTKMIGAYTKLGVYKFAELVKQLQAKGIQITEDLLSAIKKAYGAFAAENDIDALDDMKTVRTFKLSDIQPITKEKEQIISTEDNNLPESNVSLLENKQRFINAVVSKLGNEKLNIVSLRKIAEESGFADIKDTTIQEYTELAIIMKAHTIVKQEISQQDKYNQIVELYEAQPTISMRSSERIAKQQYSTPIPLSFLAGEFVNKINPKSVLEPSAGNGMMVFNVDEEIVIANEIDEVRLDNLRDQGFKEVTNQDGTLEFNIEPVDGVITNPPFGKSEARDYEGYKIAGLDEQMVVNALSSMADHGRAAIIIGGHTKYKENGTLASEKAFLNYLYDKYNVVDIINVDGSLYSKQGTTFPVRLILINGRRTGFEALQRKYAPLQKDARSEQVSTFDELYKRVKDNENNLLRSGTSVQPDSGVRTTPTSNGATIPTGTTATNRPGSGRQGESGATSTRPSQNGRPSDKPTKPTTSNDAGGSNIQPDATSGGQTVSGSTARSERRISTQDADKFLNRSNARPEPLKIDISKEKTQYPARSKSAQIGSVVPTNVAQSINDILHKFDDIDAYVQTKLGYGSKDELYNALAAEQIDSVALAIYQIENGKALIIGDMTGVGKGRQAAAIIRYAVMSGKRPIFITEKPQLFSDIYRDLRDIGSADLNPFILNSKGNEDPAMTDENGVVIYNTPKDAVKKQILASGKLPEEYDYAVLTYSQLNGNVEKNGLSAKQSFFRNIATDNILVLDESHNAGGEGNTGTFMTETLPTTKGVVFLSGTFAKRADNMPIYAMKTSMNEANMSETELIEAIKTGGIPLQEIMSKNLTETGQMVRRERDFTGVTIDWQTMTDKKEQHWKTFDGVIELFNELIKFQKDYIDPVIEAMNDDVADVQGSVDARTGTRDLGISNQPFASKTFNLVRQMLFSLKAQEVADEAIKELKAGNKPVIAIGNTMETFINDIGAVGTTTDKHDYSLTLVRGLTGLFRVTETDANGERIQHEIDKSIIGAEGLAKYAELEAKINKLSSGISISPIDVIKAELSKAGYSVGEMTGRSNELVFNEDGTATVSKRTNTDKKKLARDFNSGSIDVLILNQSASTGISLHASNKFKDQRKRVMLFAQNQLDVNTEVQMRGRIDRTGQVQRGAYRYIISPIPAEQRMIMMFKAKLKSLDANTTSSQKSKTNEIEVVDFLNKYGDEIVIEYLKENPDINLKMLDPFNLADKSEDELAKITTEVGAASKAAGRAALLSVKEQEAFYTEITEKYNTLINYLNDAGANDLEITTLPLKAETKAKHIVIQGKNSGNPFSEDSVRETVEVDVLKKPMNIKEVNEEIQKLTEGKTAVEYRDALISQINDYTENQVAQETKKIQDEIGKKQESFFAKAEKEADRGKLEGEARNEFMDAKRQDFDSMMQLHIDTRTNAIRNRAQTILRTVKSLPVGKVVLIPSTLEIGTDTTYSEGMFLGFRMKEKLTPSTITAVFATLDGRRRIDVPLSKVPFLQAVYSETMQNIRHIKATPENWDSMIPTRTRKTAYIITGNILQAYGRNELRGQLVSYSTVSGEIRQGILLPDKYKSDEQAMRVQVIDRINDLRNGQSLADVSNGVTIRKEGDFGYSISVPLSKVRGGKYFLDAGLREFVEHKDFRQMSGQMVGYVPKSKIEPALRYLSDKFNISVDVAIKKVDDEPQFQTLSEEYDNAASAKERYNAAVEMVAEMDAQNGTKTIIARDNEDFISMLPEKYADFVRNNRIGAVLYKGTLIINQVNQVDADAIRTAYEHENAHIANNAVHTREELSELWDNVTESERRLVTKVYSKMGQHVKGDELITYAIEDIIKKQGYENYKNGNVDLSLYSEALQNKLKKTIDYANNKYLANNGRRIQNGSTTDGRTIGRFQQVNGEGTRTGNRGTTNGTDQLAETINIENKLFEPIERLIDTEYIAKRNEAQEEISITEAIGANNVPYPADLWGEAYKSYTTNAPIFNSRNIYSAIYKEGHRLKRIQSLKPLLNFDREVTWDKLPEKLEEGKNYDNAYKVGAPKINTIRALKFSDEFNYIIDQYAEVLVRAKQLSTPAAQEIINDVLKDIEYAKDYYERYAKGEDVWRTEKTPSFQIIGERGAEALDAAEEATTRLDNLRVAKEMEAATKTPHEIRMATGWEKGVDGLWRYEVPDGNFKNIKYSLSEIPNDESKLSDIWDDDKLFEAYPQLKEITVKVNNNSGYGGSYIKETNTIEINLLRSVGKEGQKSTLIHEIQHAIQEIEGFAKGGSTESIRPEMLQYPMMIKKAQERIDDYYQNHPDGIAIDKESDEWLESNTNPTEEEYAEFESKMKAKYPSVNSISQYTEIIKQQRKNPKTREEAYKRLSGETEARNASSRMNMSEEERRQTLLSATADVAPEDQIILMDATGVSMSIPEKPQPPVFSGREDVLTRLKQSSEYAKELQKWQKKNIENIAAQVGESEEVNKKLSELNKSVDKWSAKLWEGWADGQKPVKKWQDFLKANGVEINDANDYYMRFTMMPGRVEYRFTEFDKTYIEPFIETLKAFKDRGVDYDALGTYAKLKHADEYTEHVMNQKIVERGWSDNRLNLYTLQQTQPADVVKKYWYDWAEKRILNLKNDNAVEYEQAVKSINEQRDRAIEEVTPDFAGKRAIEERLGMSADQYIADIESIGKANGLTDMFWKQVKRINEFSLMEEVRSGRRTAASAEQILSTFEWYVPLKNHYDMTAEDTFDYSTERGQFFVTAVKRGKGRRSESGDPFSVMVSTVRSSIGASEENMLKQALLRLAELDTTGSTTVSKAWFKKTGEDADGKHIFEVAPTVEWSNDDTQETYNEKVRAFEMEMQELAAKGEAYRGKIPKLKIGVWIKPTNVGEHEVHVMRNGEMYVVRFNTSPRVPQAVNKVNYRYYEGFTGAIFENTAKLTRFMAATKTMFRPTFIFITNPLRDIHHGVNLAYINRGAKFTAQAVAFLPIAATTLMRRAAGKINVNNKYDMALNNYMLYGAKTGISKILELKQMERSLKSRMTNKPHLWSRFKNVYQAVSEITENQMRFAVYLAALKNGDSTLKAVSMAKQATVNFDLKGNGRNGIREISSLYAFVRVGFQAIDGLYSASTQSAETKRRFAGAVTMNILGGMVLTGAISSLIYNMFKGDDDEEDGWINDFAKLSTYERNSNFLIWTPDGVAKYPLGQEFRVFHGLGMDMLMYMHGKATATETAINFGKGLTSLIPYNPIESAVQGSWGSAMPDVVSPWAELAANRDWMGTRIYKENQDKDAPGYMKVRTNKRGEYYASEFMYRLSKALDKATGGDEAVKGWFSPNPDVAEHLVGGYLNGLLAQTLTVADGIINKDPKEFIPSAVWKSSDDIRQRTGGLNEVYYDVKEATEKIKNRADRYEEAKDELKKEFEKGLIDEETYNSSIRRINNSLNALDKSEYYTHKGVLSTISELEAQLKANKGDKPAQQRIETSINELKEYLAGGDTLKGYYGTRAKYVAKREAADDYRKWLKKQAEQNIQVEPDEAKYTDVIMIFEGPKGKKSFNSILEDIDKELEKNPDNEELRQQAIEIMNTIINP